MIYSQQDTSARRYFPLNVGNYYVFIRNYNYSQYSITTSGISGSAVFEGKLYYQFYGYFSGYLRYDSLSGNIFQYDNTFNCSFYSHVKQIDSLWARTGDGNNGCNYGFPGYYRCGMNGYSVNVLGYQTQAKSFDIPLPNNNARYYAKDIGLYYYDNITYHGNSVTYTLKGCIVNGVLYGDTSLFVGIQPISAEIPNQFSLFQNYPNPFNPATKIRFNIPQNEMTQRVISTSLMVYDALGKEVAVLFNQQLQPGTYEADWDASAYPSGVYYYRIESGSFTEAKKMVLIK